MFFYEHDDFCVIINAAYLILRKNLDSTHGSFNRGEKRKKRVFHLIFKEKCCIIGVGVLLDLKNNIMEDR